MIAIPCSRQDMDELMFRFEQQDITKPEWTHEAHLVAAVWYLSRHSVAECIDILREKIKLLNVSLGGVNTDMQGYHETMTRFWLWVAHQFMQQNPNMDMADACTALIQSPYAASKYPLVYYSKDCLFSVEARLGWVEPDVEPLKSLIISN